MGISKVLVAISISLFLLSPYKYAKAAVLPGPDTLDVGNAAPPFVMRDLVTNGAVYLRDYTDTAKTLRQPWKKKERHVVVLSFWATWCHPCKNEIPILMQLAKQFQDQRIKFFLINTMENADQSEDSVRYIYKNRGYTIQSLIDPSCRYAGMYSIRALPVLVVIDKFGVVRKINRGYHENFQIELEVLLNELVKEEESVEK